MTTMAKTIKALLKVIKNDTTLMGSTVDGVVTPGLITGVFDNVPEGQKMPYITLGEVSEDPEYLMGGEKNWDTLITLYIWSQNINELEELDILDRLETLLETDLSLSDGFVVTDQRLKKSTTERQSNYVRYVPLSIYLKVEKQ